MWRRCLVEEPQGRARGGPGSVRYADTDLAPLEGTTLLYSGRFTEVKRLRLLIEAYAAVRARFGTATGLVLLGGFPGEWEGEHPIETIDRLGLDDVFLAGWHAQDELPGFLNCADVMVHASIREQFGQVLVEAMACAVPPIAVDRGGPADIVDSGRNGAGRARRRRGPRAGHARGRQRPRRAPGARRRRLPRSSAAVHLERIGASLAGELREVEAGAVRVSSGTQTARPCRLKSHPSPMRR